MEKLTDYLTSEGWSKDWQKTRKRNPALAKEIDITKFGLSFYRHGFFSVGKKDREDYTQKWIGAMERVRPEVESELDYDFGEIEFRDLEHYGWDVFRKINKITFETTKYSNSQLGKVTDTILWGMGAIVSFPVIGSLVSCIEAFTQGFTDKGFFLGDNTFYVNTQGMGGRLHIGEMKRGRLDDQFFEKGVRDSLMIYHKNHAEKE